MQVCCNSTAAARWRGTPAAKPTYIVPEPCHANEPAEAQCDQDESICQGIEDLLAQPAQHCGGHVQLLGVGVVNTQVQAPHQIQGSVPAGQIK